MHCFNEGELNTDTLAGQGFNEMTWWSRVECCQLVCGDSVGGSSRVTVCIQPHLDSSYQTPDVHPMLF